MNCTQVLNAECIPIEDRIYRLLPIRESLRSTDDNEPSMIHLDEDDDDFELDLPIIHQGDKFYVTFHIPASLTGLIIGYENRRRMALEQQNNIKIDIQKRRNETAMTVSASSRKAICNGYSNIMNKVNAARLREESTHFVSFPINSQTIQESFLKFKAAVLEKYNKVRGIDASIFQKPEKLHITVAVLVLLNERDKENSIEVLTKCKNTVLKDLDVKEFIVQVKGLEYMNDDPAEVDILYAKVEELDGDDSLQILADKVMNEFVYSNLSKKQYSKVKLHVTLMNTLFRDNLESTDNMERKTFDSRKILKDFKDYDFGQIGISDIHISIRYTHDESNGYYKHIHKMKFST